MNTCGISGEFHLKVVDSLSGKVTKERKFKNLILNSGLVQWAKGNPGGGAMQCNVGVGTTPPLVTDTSLQSQIAVTNFENRVTTTIPEAPTYRISKKSTCRFAAGAISNTITEIGVRYASAGNAQLCRQLILNESGEVSALAVLPNEYLDVTYVLWYYPNIEDILFSFVMDGVTYNCTSRLSDATRAHVADSTSVWQATTIIVKDCYAIQTLGDITQKPQGVSVSGSAMSTMLAYDDSKPYSWQSSVTLGLSAYNTGSGIGSLYLEDYSGLFARQINFSPVLPKDANTELTLVFADSIGRYTGA